MQFDLICYSHLRWDFVYQRPQHLMSRIAETHRVFFVEEQVFDERDELEIQKRGENLWVVVPHISWNLDVQSKLAKQRNFLSRLIESMKIKNHLAWYYLFRPSSSGRYSL